jgi:hypothetical protein
MTAIIRIALFISLPVSAIRAAGIIGSAGYDLPYIYAGEHSARRGGLDPVPGRVDHAIVGPVRAFFKIRARIACSGAAANAASLAQSLICLILIFQFSEVSQVIHGYPI